MLFQLNIYILRYWKKDAKPKVLNLLKQKVTVKSGSPSKKKLFFASSKLL